MVAVVACSEPNGSPTLPAEFHGTWLRTAAYGGEHGLSRTGEPGTFGRIVIEADRFPRYDVNDDHMATFRFTAWRGPSIYASEPEWLLSSADQVLVIRLVDGELELMHNEFEGIGGRYVRAVSSDGD